MVASATGPTSGITRAVLLGAKGFIASHLTVHLQKAGIPHLALPSSELNLEDSSSIERLGTMLTPSDRLIFISALTPDKGRDTRTLMRNLTMAEHVAASLERVQCSSIIYVSSDAVYSDDAHPIREDSPCDPSSFHGVMHITREKIMAEVCGRLKIPLVRLRPCAVYGPGDTHNSYGPNRFLKSAREGGKITLGGEGEEIRDHIYIHDLCRVILKSLHFSGSETLNVATGHAVSFREVADTVRQVVAAPIDIVGTTRQNPITHRHFDVTKILRLFPDFSFVSIEKGLAETHQQTRSIVT